MRPEVYCSSHKNVKFTTIAATIIIIDIITIDIMTYWKIKNNVSCKDINYNSLHCRWNWAIEINSNIFDTWNLTENIGNCRNNIYNTIKINTKCEK